MIKNIIFDWTGVINDNIKTGHCAAMAVFRHFGVPVISVKEFVTEWEQPYIHFYRKYIPGIDQKEENEIFCQAIPKCPKSKMYKGADNLIKKLKANGIKMFIISSDPDFAVKNEVVRYGMIGCFKKIVCDLHDKTEAVSKVIKDNNLVIAETIFVGDTTHEIEVGNKAGLKTIAVTWGMQTEEKLQSAQPDFIAHNIHELELILCD